MRREIFPLAAFVALVGAVVLGSGCGFGMPSEVRRPSCTSDDQCSPGEVCFPDGCGDPHKEIRVEVTPNVAQGYHAQDFPVDEVRPVLNLEVFEPSAIAGTVERRNISIGPSSTFPYEFPVTFNVTGESALIPGLVRRFSATVTPTTTPSQGPGSYRIPVASGIFTVTAATVDTSIPPETSRDQTVLPGQTSQLGIVLAASGEVFRVDGRLVRTGNLPVQSAEMEVQAFDIITQKPLSQRAPASSGQTGSTGDFNLFLSSPTELNYQEFSILASPKESSALVPSKRFVVRVESVLKTPLELGDYGAPVDVKGYVVGSDGQPIANATVYLDGPVNGGGDFKSQRVLTDAQGGFALKTLPTRDGAQTTLWVIPPAKSAHGILRKLVAIPATSSSHALGNVTCLPKPKLTGTVHDSEEAPAAAVRVVAEPIRASGGGILPPSGAEAVTDEQGNYTLALDPAEYLIHFIPTSAGIPRASRPFEIVSTSTSNVLDGEMSRALTVTGRVSGRTDSNDRTLVKPIPYAGVRFFRIVTEEGGKKSSVLLAESVADAQGSYTVTLPTR